MAFPKNSSNPGDEEEIKYLYLYGTPPLILFCVVSVIVNIKVLMSVYWIKRPLSPTLHISLSLAGADAFSSGTLAIGLLMNSFIPNGLGLELTEVDCFLLALEATRLGAIIITVMHLCVLALNHYLGILKPLHYLCIMTKRNTTILIAVVWILPISFFISYFSVIENEGFQSANCRVYTFLHLQKFRLVFSSLFFGPFVIMVCIYTHIFWIVRKHQASRLRYSRASFSFSRNGNTRDIKRTNSAQQMAKNVKAIHTTLYILGSFVIGWLPGVTIFNLVCKDCLLNFDWISGSNGFILFGVVNGLIILKTLINPLIYAARMHEIQLATRQMHKSLRSCVGLKVDDSRNETIIGQSSDGTPNNRQSVRIAICRSEKPPALNSKVAAAAATTVVSPPLPARKLPNYNFTYCKNNDAVRNTSAV